MSSRLISTSSMADRNRNQSQRKRKREESSTSNDADDRPTKKQKLHQKQYQQHSKTIGIKKQESTYADISIKQEPSDDINEFNVFLNADQRVLVETLMDVLEQSQIDLIVSRIKMEEMRLEGKAIKRERIKSDILYSHTTRNNNEIIEIIEIDRDESDFVQSSIPT